MSVEQNQAKSAKRRLLERILDGVIVGCFIACALALGIFEFGGNEFWMPVFLWSMFGGALMAVVRLSMGAFRQKPTAVEERGGGANFQVIIAVVLIAAVGVVLMLVFVPIRYF